jgi:hypothetical protein
VNPILVQLEPPLASARAVLSMLDAGPEGARAIPAPLPSPDPEAGVLDLVTASVARGHESFVVDLDRLGSVTAADVPALTGLVWSILSAGGTPVVLSRDPDTLDTLHHFKMDRAFTIVDDLQAALASFG